MNINEYTTQAESTAVYPAQGTSSMAEVMYLALGLAGEAGEVADLIKKLYRNYSPAGSVYTITDDLRDELGDVLWYLVNMCLAAGFDLEEVMIRNVEKLRERKVKGELKDHA